MSDERKWHKNFIEYTEYIVSHSNYKGLFYEHGKENQIKWVVTGKSEQGLKRRKWWDSKCIENNIKIEAGCYAKIALLIHPTKKHICQICGKELSLEYVYPNKRTRINIKKYFKVSIKPFDKDIFKIIDELVNNAIDIDKFKDIFHINKSEKCNKNELKEYIKINFVKKLEKGLLSPGAMSNSPDRFDGFHSDGACCREKSDKGRHQPNMQRYGQDRRVYENWADGDWKMADRLMSLFRKYDLSADHIGPISLGFCHRPKFHPLTRAANAAKNNRMSIKDIKTLLQDENHEQVVSWHSKFIWDNLKFKVKDNKDAVKLSKLMRENLHYILIVFSMIDEKGYSKFLEQFLNPKYSFYDYKFEGFNPKTGEYKKIITKKLSGKNQQNNIKRYFRIAFEKLHEYKNKENRKIHIWINPKVDDEIEILFELLKLNENEKAKKQLNKIFIQLANLATKSW